MRKSVMILILIGITAMGLWAKGNVETASPMGDEKISLEYAYMVESGDTVELYKSMLQEYQKETPNIEVKFIPIVDDYAKKLLLMVASKTAPDIAWIGEDMIRQYASQNALVALDPYDGEFFNSSDYVQGNLEGYTYDDTLYALPFDSATGLLFINNDIFDKAGVEIPSDHITLSQLKEIAKATTIKENNVTVQYGFVTGTYMGYLHPFFRMANGTFIDANGNTTFNTEPVKEIFQYFYNLIHEDNSMPEYGSQAVPFVEIFKSGKAAMMFNGSWAVGEVMSQEDFNCTIIKLPQYKTIATPAWTGGTAVLSSTKNREAAIKFLSWFSGEEGQKIKFSGKFAASPTIKTLLDTELAYNGYKNPKAPMNDFTNLVDSLNYAYALPSLIFGNNQIMDTIEKEAEKYFLQTISLDELVTQLDKKVTKLLNE
ncbi:MAG: extracellular solute-binding protein [Spirochaetia bacterium]|nr:extracellular solute-binding protein [Spirochaetia bacterium]